MRSLIVNGRIHRLASDPEKPLLWVLRDELGLEGTKYGCGMGVCGACLVLLDGKPHPACLVALNDVGGRRVTTIEGLPEDHPVIQTWLAEQTPQCGYFQPAQILAAVALLQAAPDPGEEEISAAMLRSTTPRLKVAYSRH